MTVLINNAGIVSGKKFLELTDKQIDMTFRVNTIAHFWVRYSFYGTNQKPDSMSGTVNNLMMNYITIYNDTL